MTTPPTVLGALAAVIHEIRPTWDAPGVVAALRPLADHDLAAVTRAAVDAATTPSTSTPAGIGARVRDGWMDGRSTDANRPTPGPRQFPRCGRCGHEVTEGRADHAEHCGPPAPRMPDNARRLALAGFTRARQARQAAEHAANQTEERPASPTRATVAGERCRPHTPASPNRHRPSDGETEGAQ